LKAERDVTQKAVTANHAIFYEQKSSMGLYRKKQDAAMGKEGAANCWHIYIHPLFCTAILEKDLFTTDILSFGFKVLSHNRMFLLYLRNELKPILGPC